MIRSSIIAGICLIGLIFFLSCNSQPEANQTNRANDVLLASVESRKMYLSDIDGMITSSNKQDSIAQINALIEAWLSRNVLLNEAEKNFPQDLNIDKLIEDYRSSLMLHNYRQLLIKNDLDTIITPAQEQSFYDENKDQFLLENAICKARVVKIPDNTKRIEQFYRNWKKNDSALVNQYITENAIFDSSDNQEWQTVDHFLAFLPEKKFKESDFSKKGDVQKHDGQFEYFIKVIDHKGQNKVPPLGYIRDQMHKVIIHQRKKELLKKIEKSLYEDYLQANKIKIHKK